MTSLSSEVLKLSPQPGDMILVRCPGHLEPEFAGVMTRDLAAALPDGVKGIVLADDFTIDDQMVERAAVEMAGSAPCWCDDDWRVPENKRCPVHGDGRERWLDSYRRDARRVLNVALGGSRS